MSERQLAIASMRDRTQVAPLPEAIRVQRAKVQAIIDFATRVKDWPLLAEAIEAKIDDQVEFVGWWDEKVGVRLHTNQFTVNAERGSPSLSKEDAEHHTGVTQQQVSRWRKELGYDRDEGGAVVLRNRERYRDRLLDAAYRKAGLEAAENHRAEGTGENEWYTPEQYLAAARSVMGEIDLDPASHAVAQQRVQATRYFTRADDGLTKPWKGRVWLNPPYAQPAIGHFVSKLVGEVAAGRTTQAILLTHNYTDTTWFHAAEGAATLLCFTRGRIAFTDIDGQRCAPTQGQTFFYFGDKGDEFRRTFAEFGFVR